MFSIIALLNYHEKYNWTYRIDKYLYIQGIIEDIHDNIAISFSHCSFHGFHCMITLVATNAGKYKKWHYVLRFDYRKMIPYQFKTTADSCLKMPLLNARVHHFSEIMTQFVLTNFIQHVQNSTWCILKRRAVITIKPTKCITANLHDNFSRMQITHNENEQCASCITFCIKWI